MDMITHYLTAVNCNNQATPQEQHEQQKSVIFEAQGEILKGCKGLKCPPRIKVSTEEAAIGISFKTKAEQNCSCPGYSTWVKRPHGKCEGDISSS
jgi:hypothetical protein